MTDDPHPTDPLLEGRISTLAEACFISLGEKDLNDPFLGSPELSARFEAVLTPAQKDRYAAIQQTARDFSHVKFRLWADNGQTSLQDFDDHLTGMSKLYKAFSELSQ